MESLKNVPSRNCARQGGGRRRACRPSRTTTKYGTIPAETDLSLKAERNEIVALVGPSGSGKTTVAGLISRFFDPQEGQVLLGGTDLRQLSKEELMRRVAYVFQDSRLLKRSIADNLRIAKPDASEEELLEALKKARCSDILSRLPQGIHTVLGARGIYLSGGERQRISIARALLKNAPIVLLDEATASLDVENETKVQGALSRLLAGKTVLVIAHRMRTVEAADKIVVLKEGKVVEQGSPAALLQSPQGVFAHMRTLQSASAGWSL